MSRDFARGCGMGFVSYPHLILLISGQTFEVTVAHKKFWELNKNYQFSLHRIPIVSWPAAMVWSIGHGLGRVRATLVGLLNGLPSLYLLCVCKKLIFSRSSKWAVILVGLPNFFPHFPNLVALYLSCQLWTLYRSPIYSAYWSGGPYLSE